MCIPTFSSIPSSGVNMASSSCTICNVEVETTDHMFASGPFIHKAMYWIFKWCGIDGNCFSNKEESINFAANWFIAERKANYYLQLYMVFFGMFGRRTTINCFIFFLLALRKTADNIISLVFIWYKYKCKDGNCSWAC